MPLLVGILGALTFVHVVSEAMYASIFLRGGVFGINLRPLGSLFQDLANYEVDYASLLMTGLRYGLTLLLLSILGHASRLSPDLLVAVPATAARSGRLAYLLRLGASFTLLFCLVPSLIVLYTGEAARYGSFSTVKAPLVALLILGMGTAGVLIAQRTTRLTFGNCSGVFLLGFAVAWLQRMLLAAPIPIAVIPTLSALGFLLTAGIFAGLWRMASAPADGSYSPGAPKSSR